MISLLAAFLHAKFFLFITARLVCLKCKADHINSLSQNHSVVPIPYSTKSKSFFRAYKTLYNFIPVYSFSVSPKQSHIISIYPYTQWWLTPWTCLYFQERWYSIVCGHESITFNNSLILFIHSKIHCFCMLFYGFWQIYQVA